MTDIALFKQLGKVVHFKENQTVFMQDDEGDNMYIVLKGTFGVYINSFSSFPIRVAEVRQGSFFGEMSVIDGWPRSATIIAEEEGAALAVDVGRVTGSLGDGAANTNNYAWSNMTVNGSTRTGADASSLDGAGITEWNSAWFVGIGFADPLWTGKLPSGP